jgi:hypothetical protein
MESVQHRRPRGNGRGGTCYSGDAVRDDIVIRACSQRQGRRVAGNPDVLCLQRWDGLGDMVKTKVTLDITHGKERTMTGKITSPILVVQHL